MPRKQRDRNTSARVDVNASRRYFCPTDADWGGYINLRVAEEERMDFDGWRVEEAANIAEYWQQALVDGLKFSVTYDAENSAYIATFVGAGCKADKARYSLSARGADLFEATELLLYKHMVLLDGDWSGFNPSKGRVTFG